MNSDRPAKPIISTLRTFVFLSLFSLTLACCGCGRESEGDTSPPETTPIEPVIVHCDPSGKGDNPLDSDGDGLTDAFETQGWLIDIDLEGHGESGITTLHIYSDPLTCDTDGDGLNDGEEFAYGTDPSWGDTDQDLLSDREELEVTFSNPNSVDTDGDAQIDSVFPHPALFDGAEYLNSHTSPILADTDGDGLGDDQEILGGGTNPLVANTAKLELRVIGDPLVSLLSTTVSTDESSGTTSTLFSAATAQSAEQQQSLQRSTSTTFSTTTERSEEIGASVTGSVSYPLAASLEVSASYNNSSNFSNSTTFDTNAVADTSSSAATSQSFSQTGSQALQQAQSDSTSTTAGTLQIAMAVRNLSSIAVRLTDVRVLCFRLTSSLGGFRQLMGELETDVFDGDGILLAPGAEVSFVAENNEIPVPVMVEYLQNPRGLSFDIGSYVASQPEQILNGQVIPEQDYAILGQRVEERTGLLIIDYGDGLVEEHLIATNVDRHTDGSGAGIRLTEALSEILGYEIQTTEKCFVGCDDFDATLPSVSRSVLLGVNGVTGTADENDPNPVRSAWLTISSSMPVEVVESEGSAVSLPPNFEELTLEPGGRIELIYVTDADQDGVISRFEALLGSSDFDEDSDDDGLTDWEEAIEGYEVVLKTRNTVEYTYSADALETHFVADWNSEDAEELSHQYPFAPSSYNFLLLPFCGSESTFQPMQANLLLETPNSPPVELPQTRRRVYSSPLRSDSDADGLSDFLERTTFSTDPLLSDTDGDGISDLHEVTGIRELYLNANCISQSLCHPSLPPPVCVDPVLGLHPIPRPLTWIYPSYPLPSEVPCFANPNSFVTIDIPWQTPVMTLYNVPISSPTTLPSLETQHPTPMIEWSFDEDEIGPVTDNPDECTGRVEQHFGASSLRWASFSENIDSLAVSEENFSGRDLGHAGVGQCAVLNNGSTSAAAAWITAEQDPSSFPLAEPLNQYTISFWAKSDSISDEYTLIFSYPENYPNIVDRSGIRYLQFSTGDNLEEIPWGAYSVDSWEMYTVTVSSSTNLNEPSRTVRLYKNVTKVAELAVPQLVAEFEHIGQAASVFFGWWPFGACSVSEVDPHISYYNPWSGKLDNYRVWPTALTHQEIIGLYLSE